MVLDGYPMARGFVSGVRLEYLSREELLKLVHKLNTENRRLTRLYGEQLYKEKA